MKKIARLDEATRTALEAAAFRALVEHLRAHPEVQNIDLMNLAGFCRNCLSKWYRAAAAEQGLRAVLRRTPARSSTACLRRRKKAKHQTEASAGQQAQFEERQSSHG